MRYRIGLVLISMLFLLGAGCSPKRDLIVQNGIYDDAAKAETTIEQNTDYDAPEEEPYSSEKGIGYDEEILALNAESLQYPGENDEWKYDVFQTYVSIKAYKGSIEHDSITIPDTIDNLPVRRIGEKCFDRRVNENSYKYESLKTIKLPKEIAIIDNEAFYRVPLETISFPDNDLIIFGEGVFHGAFFNNREVEKIINHIYGDIIPAHCFDFNRSSDFSELVIPERFSTLGVAAFQNCPYLVYVDIGNINAVEQYAFRDTPLSGLSYIWSPEEGGMRWLPTDMECDLIVRNPECEITLEIFDDWHWKETFSNLTLHGLPGSGAARFASECGCRFKVIED